MAGREETNGNILPPPPACQPDSGRLYSPWCSARWCGMEGVWDSGGPPDSCAAGQEGGWRQGSPAVLPGSCFPKARRSLQQKTRTPCVRTLPGCNLFSCAASIPISECSHSTGSHTPQVRIHPVPLPCCSSGLLASSDKTMRAISANAPSPNPAMTAISGKASNQSVSGNRSK